MNILLLGATGYLGGNIAYKLINNGYHVICTVRNTSDISRLNNINAHLILAEEEEIEATLKRNKIDWIINSVCTYKQNDTLYRDMLISNIVFPLKVLNLAIKYKVKNYITLGTSLPSEFNLYSFTKFQFSNFGKFFCEKNEINFCELRLEMFYGGLYEPRNRFLNSCKIKMQNNEKLELTEGYQKRDIVRTEDVVTIILKLIEAEYIKGYKILPVGSGENHSIRTIISFMKKIIGSKSELIFGAIPSRAGEPDTIADIAWYEDIGFQLKYSFFEGLKDECKNI